MKRTINVIVILLFMAVSAFGQNIIGQASDDKSPSADISASGALEGEHSPIWFSSIDTFSIAASSTTHWMQIGVRNSSNKQSNQRIGKHNPGKFTLIFDLDRAYVGDSVGVGGITFETAIDTAITSSYLNGYMGTTPEIVNLDTSNTAMSSTAYSHQLYNTWKFLNVAAEADSAYSDTTMFALPLRVWGGSWIRLTFEGQAAVADTMIINWYLWCEN